MASTRKDRREFIIDVDQARVVLTVSPELTGHLTTAWESRGSERDEWVKALIRLLAQASGQQGLRSRLARVRPIGQYRLRGWKVGATPGRTLRDTFFAANPSTGAVDDIHAAVSYPEASYPTADGVLATEAAARASEAEVLAAAAFEVVAAAAADLARRSVALAAERAAAAADVARHTRATAVARAAEAVAETVAQAAAVIQHQADTSAIEVAHTAAVAAQAAAAVILPGRETDGAITATRLAETTATAAVATAEATAAAAAVVARAAAAAALEAAAAAADAAMVLELEVAGAAAAVQAMAIAAADQVVHDNAIRTEEMARLTH